MGLGDGLTRKGEDIQWEIATRRMNISWPRGVRRKKVQDARRIWVTMKEALEKAPYIGQILRRPKSASGGRRNINDYHSTTSQGDAMNLWSQFYEIEVANGGNPMECLGKMDEVVMTMEAAGMTIPEGLVEAQFLIKWPHEYKEVVTVC